MIPSCIQYNEATYFLTDHLGDKVIISVNDLK